MGGRSALINRCKNFEKNDIMRNKFLKIISDMAVIIGVVCFAVSAGLWLAQIGCEERGIAGRCFLLGWLSVAIGIFPVSILDD